MEYFKTAVDGLEITRVGLGTWAMGGSGWGGIVDEPAVECVRAAIDMGITLVDTAPAYGAGHSEERVLYRRPGRILDRDRSGRGDVELYVKRNT